MKITSSRISQLIFLALFIILFVNTEYRGKDEISAAINSFFRANPLVTVSYILAVKAVAILLIPGIMMILASAILGRFFCGWICPLGTIIDLITGKIRKTAPLKFLKSRFKYYLLFTLLAAALFNVNIAGVFDPIAILVRALTFFLYPLLGYTARSGWAGLYSALGEKRDYLDPLFAFLRDYVLPFRETFYPLAFLSLIFFAGILFLERYEKRNWCKNLCPLGTLLGLTAKLSLFKRIPGKLCADCGKCKEVCPTGFDRDTLQKSDCILCMDCRLQCAFKRVAFPFKGIPSIKREKAGDSQPVMGRRVFMGSIVSGFFLSRVFTFQPPVQHERLLRPPGVKDEKDFLKKCVRCGECIKVCLRSALYPDYFKAGLYGVFMPVIIPRLGYCEYNCNLCGQVCPTGAIPNLPLEKKKKSVIGVAHLDKNHCLPYARKINCIVCEEHCPVPEKAIRFEVVEEKDHSGKTVTLKRPYVVEELCNGCGICENKCPLEGKSAIEVFAQRRRLTNT
ncbi:MAG TPA: 4Fe-4S binding protein [Syntrophorhabdaceae bacterium]|nr:4Fe-4S binding protein [Syntrophorhabdaceae bacterium]HQM81032.1 4Fe-4S binding protein [Syntrophorhabdaceae bacterium]